MFTKNLTDVASMQTRGIAPAVNASSRSRAHHGRERAPGVDPVVSRLNMRAHSLMHVAPPGPQDDPRSSAQQSQQGVSRQAHYIPEEESGLPGFFTVRGQLRLPVNPDMVWEVLTAHEDAAQVYSTVQASRVESSSDGNKLVVQTCGWRFLTFTGTFDTRINVAEDPASQRINFKLVESAFMKDFEGRWHVATQQQGSGEAPMCVIEHVLSVKPFVAIPAMFSSYARPFFVKQVEGVLQDLEREVIRRQGLN